MNRNLEDGSPRGDYFVTTQWTMVLSAGRRSSPDSDRALAELCQTYWYPLYAYVRCKCPSREDAEDLTQAFFERFLRKNYLEGLDADCGRFRAFMLAAIKHFLANEWDKANRQKRGGGTPLLSLDYESAEKRYRFDPADHSSPDRLFDKEWALALLERVLGSLRLECALEGRGSLFERSRGFLMMDEDSVPYAKVSEELGISPGALRAAVCRMRKRFREMLRKEIAQTLRDPSSVQEEIRSLWSALCQ